MVFIIKLHLLGQAALEMAGQILLAGMLLQILEVVVAVVDITAVHLKQAAMVAAAS
jgi:hypothetical protein